MDYYAYSFLAGIFVGGYTNFFSKVIISGLVFYIVHPDNFHPRRFQPLYLQIKDKTYPYLSKIYSFTETEGVSSSSTLSKSTSNSTPSKLTRLVIKTDN